MDTQVFRRLGDAYALVGEAPVQTPSACPFRATIDRGLLGRNVSDLSMEAFELWDLATLELLQLPDVGKQTLRMLDGRLVTSGPGVSVLEQDGTGGWTSAALDDALVLGRDAALGAAWFFASNEDGTVRAYEETGSGWVERDGLQFGTGSVALATDGVSLMLGRVSGVPRRRGGASGRTPVRHGGGDGDGGPRLDSACRGLRVRVRPGRSAGRESRVARGGRRDGRAPPPSPVTGEKSAAA